MGKPKQTADEFASSTEIIVRGKNELAVPTKDNFEEWLKGKMVQDAPERYAKLQRAMDLHLEPQFNEEGKIIHMPSIKVMELSARMLGVDPGTGGTNITFNQNSGNTTVVNSNGPTLEEIIKRLDQRDAANYETKVEKAEPIEGEFEDVKPKSSQSHEGI